jgi:tetraacyldisaccharide 4'-kinase
VPWQARVLQPIGQAYAWAAERRLRGGKPYRSRLPVVCIGNFTAGGTGKTPLALLVVQHLRAAGRNPAILTRGYGGRSAGPLLVEPDRHTAADVGDEPLLLAAAAPVMMARDRAAGARAIEADPRFDVILMDDGLQNPTLAKDLVIAVIDGTRGVGNGEVIPAGPLRARLEFQLGLTDAVVVNASPSERSARVVDSLKRGFPGPVLEAAAQPRADTAWLAGQRVLAFAGIGNPDRFFRLVEELGGRVVEQRAFPDHHAFTARDAERLLASAMSAGALLVTTEKDWVRIDGRAPPLSELKAKSRTLPIRLAMSERDALRLAALLAGLRPPATG